MSEIVNGVSNRLFVTKETSLASGLTLPAYPIRGKTRFSWQAINQGGQQRVGIWRQPTKESNQVLFYQGSIELEYSHNEATRLLLDSLLYNSAVQINTPSAGLTTYTFRPHRTEPRNSVAIDVNWQAPSSTIVRRLRGVIIEAMTIQARRNELCPTRFDFKCVYVEDITSSGDWRTDETTVAHVPMRTADSQITFAGVAALPIFAGWDLGILARVEPKRIGSDRRPQRFSPQGTLAINGELNEYVSDSNEILSYHVNESEIDLGLKLLLPGSAKGIEFLLPKIKFQTGTPDGIGAGDLMNRANFSAMIDEGLGASASLVKFII